jgi:hypothetical protein
MLKIDEAYTAEGEIAAVCLRLDAGEPSLTVGTEELALPAGAIDAVMVRYGAPIDEGERLTPVSDLDLGGGRTLRHVRHLGRYDVIARDYLVYEAPGQEPICALAISVTGPLIHLAKAAAGRGSRGPQGLEYDIQCHYLA